MNEANKSEKEANMAVDGTYKVVVTTPMGPREATLTLKSDGTNLSGTFEDNMGKSEFSGGTINGNNLEWKAVAKNTHGSYDLEYYGYHRRRYPEGPGCYPLRSVADRRNPGLKGTKHISCQWVSRGMEKA